MNEALAAEMERILELMNRIKEKPLKEQIALIRSHISTTVEEARAR
ncbi:hypothetical protein [Hyphomicrobium sp. DY-1]